jgi:glycosyltransferase involved in cell wall biosynthesis
MPVYNGEPFLADAIESALAQSFGDFELIISDNASADGTEDICRSYAAQDSRIRYSRNPENLGASPNYNKCFSLATAEFFRWANADDLSHPDLHARCYDGLQAHPDAVLCYGKTRIIDEEGRLIREYEDNLDLRQERPSDRFRQFTEVVGLTNAIYGLMRSSALAQTGLMGDFLCADIHLMAELTLHGKFVELPQRLFSRRFHSKAFSQEKKTTDREAEEHQRAFWNPKRRGFTMQTWRRTLEYFKEVSRAPIGRAEKLRLYRYIARTMYWQHSELSGEMKEVVKRTLFQR